MKRKLTATQRNDKIYSMLVEFLKNSPGSVNFKAPFDGNQVAVLFETSIWGHREIVLTILMARLINPRFKASVDFYACNPRSIFEKPIRKALREYGIPHRKSGPLNVAKNVKKINKDWATDKNGGDLALYVVDIVNCIERVSKPQLTDFAQAYISRYKQEAKRIKDMELDLPPQENPIYISRLCADLIDNVPDGGATAQLITGLLMEAQNIDKKNSVTVSGYTDSVSTTNTTSKKPGDIIELLDNGSELVYEITTKEFSDDRLIESYEAVSSYNSGIKDVFVICRPEDVPESLENNRASFILATTQYKNISYYFVSIYGYIQSVILFVTPKTRSIFYDELLKYINQINTSEKVKTYFKLWHSENKKS